MVPARLLSPVEDDDDVAVLSTSKRRKLEAVVQDEGRSIVSSHPLNLKPSGNVFAAERDIKMSMNIFARLPDELLLQVMEWLEPVDLIRLGSTCKAFYAFCTAEDLWKTLFIENPPKKAFSWRGSWRSTLLDVPADLRTSINCTDLYSDVLYLPYHRAHVPLECYAQNIPPRNAISRISDLTADNFNTNWATKPFILTEPVRQWPILDQWSWQYLNDQYHDTLFRAEAVDWPYSTYQDYMKNNTDESPLYLFDCHFAEKMGLSIGDTCDPKTFSDIPAYTPPACFSPDLFTALGSHRPDHRWLIIGPSRSGSTFHADPNGTSAWNAVIKGSKYWIMFPPTSDPASNLMPGLHISPDGSHITAPLSIAEYLLTFHAEARRHPGCIEAICQEGEVLHVPSGWYHMVLNLEDGIALTQNFVPKAHLVNVLEFLRDKKEQVSGFGRDDVDDKYKGVEDGREYELFVERLKVQFPIELETGLEEMARRDEKRGRKSKWEVITGRSKAPEAEVEQKEDGGFSFGFGLVDDEED